MDENLADVPSVLLAAKYYKILALFFDSSLSLCS